MPNKWQCYSSWQLSHQNTARKSFISAIAWRNDEAYFVTMDERTQRKTITKDTQRLITLEQFPLSHSIFRHSVKQYAGFIFV